MYAYFDICTHTFWLAIYIKFRGAVYIWHLINIYVQYFLSYGHGMALKAKIPGYFPVRDKRKCPPVEWVYRFLFPLPTTHL